MWGIPHGGPRLGYCTAMAGLLCGKVDLSVSVESAARSGLDGGLDLSVRVVPATRQRRAGQC